MDSVLAQKVNFDYEILIGEDDSTDGTRNIVKTYKEKYPDRIKVFLNSRKDVIYIHGRPTGRWNFVNNLRNAQGEYIALLDGDDYWIDPGKLQKQVDVLEQNAIFSGCFHETQVVLENGEPGRIYGKEANEIISAEDTITTVSPFHTSSFVFRRAALQIPEWFSQVVSGDMALFSIVAAAGPLKKLPEVMSVYQKHKRGISSTSQVVDNFHTDRIELISRLDEFHRYQFRMKAKKVIDFHQAKVIETDAPAHHSPRMSSFMPSSKSDNFVTIKLTPDNIDLYYVRSTILANIREQLSTFRGVFLDIGCGEMPYKPLIAPVVDKYIGLDIENPKYQRAVKPDLFWDGSRIPLDNDSVDSVMATELFEHLPDLEAVLREIFRVLKPGGKLFFTVPFLWPLHDMPQDEYRYTPFSLKRHLGNAGFPDCDVKALGGWDASLAQMIGLWLKRRPMSEKSRSDFSSVLFPFYQDLLAFESQNKAPVYEDMSQNSMMITGLTGVAQKPVSAPAHTSATDAAATPADRPQQQQASAETAKAVLAIVCPQVGAASETFIRKHLELLMPGQTVVVTGGVVDRSWLNAPILTVPQTRGRTQYPPPVETSIVQFFQEHGVTHVLCEFGSVGSGMVELNDRRLHLPLYVHFHGQDASEELRKPDMVSYYQWMGARATAVIAVSRPMAERLKGIGIPAEKVHIVHYGVFVPAAEYASPEQLPCRVIAVSRLVAKKGILHLLNAFAKAKQAVPEMTLDIVGEGPLRAEIENFVQENHLGNAVCLHGQKPNDFVLSMLDRSSIYAQHSMTDPATGNAEGLPVGILEAAAHGLPVISTFHEGIPEEVEHGVSGLLVKEGDADTMAEYLVRLARDGGLRKEMGMAGRKKIASGFTVDQSLGKLRSVMGLSADTPEPATQKNGGNSGMRRILFVNHSIAPYERSGTPISTWNHALGMKACGREVAVLIPAHEVVDQYRTEVISGITVYKVPRLDKYQAFFGEIGNDRLTAYLESVETIVKEFRPDDVQINDYVYMPPQVVRLFHDAGCTVVRNVCNEEELCHWDYPVIGTGLGSRLCSGPETAKKCADCYVTTRVPSTDPAVRQKIEDNIQKRRDYVSDLYASAVDGVIFTEPAFKDHFEKFIPLAQEKIRIVPRGFQFDFERVTAVKTAQPNMQFAFMGNVMFSKGIDTALRAFEAISRLDNFTLHIYGQMVNKEYAQWINKLEQAYPGKIKYHGPYKKEDLPAISRSIDVAIIPSYFDTYNRVMREMLFCGIPLITTDFFGASIIKDRYNGLKVPVGDHDALAQCMKQLLEKPGLVAELSAGVIKTAIPTLSEEIEAMVTFYESIASQKGSAASAPQTDKTPAKENVPIKAIAFYLPQFHPIPENDAWWGKGFTEWTTAAKAKPLFPGHYQPHVPADLGYYDLRLAETRKAQAELARQHGIYGFCYYHYWFNGKLLLEKPSHDMLASGEPDFPFCLCWANEDWTRAWDGKSGEILIKQNYNHDDDIAHVKYLFKFFADKRYIRVNGKPLFLVYRASRMPDPKKTTALWREEARKQGIGELFLCKVESSSETRTDPKNSGFDAAVEFQPDWNCLPQNQKGPEYGNQKVYKYSEFSKNVQQKPVPSYTRFPCVLVSWDNYPRRGQNGQIFIESNPSHYQKWLQATVAKIHKSASDDKIVFINAWNEWGEGNHLEPDLQFGRGYLEATKNVLMNNDVKLNEEHASSPESFARGTRANIILPPKPTFAIRICTPSKRDIGWGDTYFGQKLTESFLKAGYQCQLYCMDEWHADRNHDVSIHLKGLSRYVPLRKGFNIIWIISHPELITKEEVEQYDLILCASKIFTDHLKKITSVPCYYLPQATDDLFFAYSGDSAEKSFDLLFVGNNYEFRHGKRRKIIQDLLDTRKEYNLRVIGPHWEGYLGAASIVGTSIESERLPEIYSKAKINLNDHHSAMAQYGFINNRTFDLAALKQFQISNQVPGIEEFGIVTYKDPEDLKNKLDYYLANDGARTAVAALNYEKCREHTFSNTARNIIHYLNSLQEGTGNAGISAVDNMNSPLPKLLDAKKHKGQKMKVVFAVTETGEMSTAGDYFTAMEFGRVLNQRFGWDVELVPANRWYDVADADVLVAMTHIYDITRLGLSGSNMIKICWMRNWFDGWAEQPFFHLWDIYLASSRTAVSYLKEKYRVTAHLLRIATNPQRFESLGQVKNIDYCFTGSYWNDPRDIEKLDPETIGLKFALYGKNWDGHPQFKKYNKGFVPYLDLPKIYNQSKILVDDANRVTKQWGSVNSRVFDALAAGTLVITNSEESSRDAFENQLPVYKTPAALKELLKHYIDSSQEYESKLKVLREIVLKQHTYEVRAQEFSDILSDHLQKGNAAVSGNAIVVSIIIPVFNRVELTRQCLSSLFATTRTPGHEIIIVDNGSTDGTGTFLAEMAASHDNLHIVQNKENIGFAKANNQAVRSAAGNYLLFLNNDTEPQPGWLAELLEIAENDQTTGAVASKLLYPNRTIQHAGVIIVNDKQNGDPLLARNRYVGQPADHVDANQPMVYQALTAACLLVRKSAFQGVGGFDESYWNGYEDVDLCFKLRENGWNLVYQPRSVVIHHESQSGPERFAMARQNISTLHRKWLDKIKPDYLINKDGTVVPTDAKLIQPYSAPTSPADEINHRGKIQDGLVSIVILTFNQLKYTKECVASIRKHTLDPHEIIFVDNRSTDGTVKWLRQQVKEHDNYRLIENGQNLGFAKGCNQGIATSKGEYILLLNNDVVVTESWLSGMLECLKSAEDIGIVGPLTNNISGVQKVEDVGYASTNELADYAKKFTERNRHRRIPLRRIVGFCMLFRRTLAEKIGMLDESFGTGNFEDDDYCYRAAQAGYQNMIAGDVFIHHYGSRSFIGNNINYADTLYGNNRIFNSKWGKVDTQTGSGKTLSRIQTLESADELYQSGRTDDAIKKLLEGIQRTPDEEEIYYFFAEILIDSKRYQDALDAANGLPEKAQQNARYFEIIGYCKEGLSLLDEAEECADKALTLKPDSAAALNLKGLIVYKRGDKASAREYFNKAVKADPGYAEPYTNLGVLQWAEDDKKTALDLLEKGCILSATSADSLTMYHSAISSQGEFARAEVVLREAKDLHPMNKKISFLLIDTFIQQAKYGIALAEIERAIITFGIDDGILAAAIEVRGKIGAQEKRDTQKHERTLSLVMIVKNEEQYLAKCLMSVKPITQEMIVVDTGSTDRTKDIAKAFGAKVFDFAWNADFAAARNFSLSKASGDWIFVMDADEVLSPLDYPFFITILKKTTAPRTAYSINTRNYSNSAADEGWSPNDEKYSLESAGCGWFPSKKVRLFPRDEAIGWVNPVHEMVEPTLAKRGIEIRSGDAVIHHYGRLNQEKLIAKHEHYYALGKKKLEENSNDSKALFELAIQAAELKKYDEAIELFKLVIALKPDDDLAYYNMGANYLAIGKYNEALIASKKAIELAPGRKEAATNYATSELLVGDLSHAAALIQDVVDKNPDYPVGLALLASIYFIRGDNESGWRYFEKLRAAKFNFLPFIHDTATRLKESDRIDYAKKMIDAARTYGYTNPEIEQLRMDCDESTVLSS